MNCSSCKYFFKLTENVGACIARIKLTRPNWHCPQYEQGENEVNFEKIVELYHQYNEAVKMFNEAKESLREIILQKCKDGTISVGNFIVKIDTIKQKRLDVKKVKSFLADIGKLDDFIVETEFRRILVRRL